MYMSKHAYFCTSGRKRHAWLKECRAREKIVREGKQSLQECLTDAHMYVPIPHSLRYLAFNILGEITRYCVMFCKEFERVREKTFGEHSLPLNDVHMYVYV